MVFQEPSTALNPVYTVGWQIMEGLRAHSEISKKEARAKAIEILGRVGIPDPEVRVDHYPPVLGRPEAARRDRDGARARPRAHRGRRADDGARRDRAGRDPRPAAPMPRRVRHRDRAHHAQHGRHRPGRPGGGHVPGQRRRAGGRQDPVRGAAGRLHQGAARRRAVRRPRHRARGRAGGGPPANWTDQPPVVEATGLGDRPGRSVAQGSGRSTASTS